MLTKCILKGVKSSHKISDWGDNALYSGKCQSHIPCSFSYKLVGIDDKFGKPIFPFRINNVVHRFINAILKEYDYCKKVIKKHFNKNLFMFPKDEKRF